jgi:hypothetical protein
MTTAYSNRNDSVTTTNMSIAAEFPHMVSQKFLPSRIASYSVFIKFSHERSSDRSGINVIAKLQQLGADAR